MFDGVVADRMNSVWIGLDVGRNAQLWWIGLDWILKNGPTDISMYYILGYSLLT